MNAETQTSDEFVIMRAVFTQNRWLFLSVALWLGAIGSGLGMMANYAAQPGAVGTTPTSWPKSDTVQHDSDRFHLILAVHPRCPCTRSTIDELEQVLANSVEKPRILALIFEPTVSSAAEADEFARTSISRKLSRLPGVELIADPGSLIAQSFGAMTSGHAVVYSPDGSLVYSGGLTPTRAHTGPNTGSSTLKSLFNGDEAIAASAAVYGCPLCPDSDTTDCLTTEQENLP